MDNAVFVATSAILLLWLRHAGGQTSYTAAIHHSGGSQSLPAASFDANQDAWPDDPFAGLADGDLWLASTSSRTVAALRWQGLGGTDSQPVMQAIDLDLLRPDLSAQRLLVEALSALAEAGDIAILLIGAAPDLESLLGSDEAGRVALPRDRTLLTGGLYIEISVLISTDSGKTFDEIDPARVQNMPIHLRIENLTAPVDAFPVLYEHPTYIDSDTQFGLTPLAEMGTWTPVSGIILPHDDRAPDDKTYLAYLEAELRSLSVFAPMIPSDEQDGGGGDTTGGSDDDSTDSDDDSTGSGDDTKTIGSDSDNDITGDGAGEDDGGGGLALLSLPVVYVDFEYIGEENGTEEEPFNSLDEALATVEDGGTIFVAPAVTHETRDQITKPVSVQLWNVTRQVSTDVATIGDIASCGPDIDSFSYDDFSSAAALLLYGNAVLSSEQEDIGYVDLVQRGPPALAGAIWTRRKMLVERGFDTTFTFRLKNGGFPQASDGISFVIQNSSPTPALTTGGLMGYTGIYDSVAVEFDAFRNVENNDPPFPHVGVHTRGIGNTNNAFEGYSLETTEEGVLLYGSDITARIVYDPRNETLRVFVGEELVLSLSQFRIEDHMNLDEGHAYIGLMATTGIASVTNGRTTLRSWSTDFPQSCEEVYWERPLHHTLNLGYNGDVMDHRITGTFLQAGDDISEELAYVSDDVGLTPQDIASITGHAPGIWNVVQDTRHGVTGLWRGRSDGEPNNSDADFDEHSIDTSDRQAFIDLFDGAGVGDLVLIQTMRHIATGAVVARHRLTYRFVKISAETTDDVQPPIGEPDCEFFDLLDFKFHQVAEKQKARNDAVWNQAHQPNPTIPCPN